jgi:pyridoxamine 5'-phosphate oxidase
MAGKGAELAANPRAAAVLHWLVPAHRQVRVAGPVEPVSADEADQYWSTRAPAARLTAAASHQSGVVAGRAVLETQVQDGLRRHPGGAGVPRPRRWGGFRVLPSRVEFWQESPDGLYDRIRYRREGGGWTIEQLSP